MINWFKKVWHDPVWSKVIASVIFLIVSSAAVIFWEYITRAASLVWIFINADITIPIWNFSILFLLSLAFFLNIIVNYHRKTKIPAWKSYREDTIEGIKWIWYSDYLEDVTNLRPCCITCGCELLPQHVDNGVEFLCPKCLKKIEHAYPPYHFLKDFVTKQIQNNQRALSKK